MGVGLWELACGPWFVSIGLVGIGLVGIGLVGIGLVGIDMWALICGR